MARIMATRIQKTVDISLLALGATMLSCQLTMMYLFIGGNNGGDAQALLVIQVWVAAIAILVFLVEAVRRIAVYGLSDSLRTMWHAMPAWVVLALIVLNSLVIIGELSLYLRQKISGQVPLWFEHAPLLCVLACSLTFIALFSQSSLARSDSEAAVGRW